MRVLLIKTSSMGDVIHALPAITDAAAAHPGIQFDWVVESPFAEIPAWHPNVDRVIPVAVRQWRKQWLSPDTRRAWKQCREQLGQHPYDIILDAQGLVKSAVIGFFAKGKRVGLDWSSARESLASLAYQRRCTVNFYQHAIVRMRQLFSQALGYPLPSTPPDFGVDRRLLLDASGAASSEKYIVFLHGTTWASKLWPETYWLQLAKLAAQAGYRIKMSAGNPQEVARGQRLASHCDAVDFTPYLSISSMATLLAGAEAAVAVDTGFGHLAAALDVPTVSLYGSTNPEFTGALGPRSIHLAATFSCAPCLTRQCTYKGAADITPACYQSLPPVAVWEKVCSLLSS